MDDVPEEITEAVSDAEVPEPLEVKVVNKELRESSPYDGHDDYEHDELKPTKEQIQEFEDGDT